MKKSLNRGNGDNVGGEHLPAISDMPGNPTAEDAIKKLEHALVDLCSAFASANGMKPEFYYNAGREIAKRRLVAINSNQRAVDCAEEDLLYDLLMELGHPRGQYVARLVANRISRFFGQVNERGGVVFLENLLRADSSTAEKMLLPLFGVGPSFVSVFLLLSGLSEPSNNGN